MPIKHTISAAERDLCVLEVRDQRIRQDRHDTETEPQLRWHLRAQVRAGVMCYRAHGIVPNLASHRLAHSDAVRREQAGVAV